MWDIPPQSVTSVTSEETYADRLKRRMVETKSTVLTPLHFTPGIDIRVPGKFEDQDLDAAIAQFRIVAGKLPALAPY